MFLLFYLRCLSGVLNLPMIIYKLYNHDATITPRRLEQSVEAELVFNIILRNGPSNGALMAHHVIEILHNIAVAAGIVIP